MLFCFELGGEDLDYSVVFYFGLPFLNRPECFTVKSGMGYSVRGGFIGFHIKLFNSSSLVGKTESGLVYTIILSAFNSSTCTPERFIKMLDTFIFFGLPSRLNYTSSPMLYFVSIVIT